MGNMKSIRWRIAIPYILLAIISLAGVAWYFSTQIKNQYQNAEQERLTHESELVARLVGDQFDSLDAASFQSTAAYYANELNARVTLIGRDGTVLGDSESQPAEMENHATRPEVKAALGGETASDIRFSETLLSNRLYTAVPILRNGEILGVARLSIPLDRVTQDLRTFQRTLVAVTIGIILLIIALAILVSENTIHPLRQLTAAASQTEMASFADEAILDRKDEIGVLSRALFHMSQKLDSDFQQLETEQQKLYAVLSSMSDGVVITDGEGMVQLLNPAASRLFNMVEHQALGHSLTEVMRHHQLIELWKKTRATGEQQSMTLDVGVEKLYLQVFVTPMGGAMANSTLFVLQDLTRLRKLETVRQDFISNVSHELRTPLAAVKSLSETLQEGALEDPPAARHFLSMMDKEIDAMAQIVQELLELSRIESGRAPLQKRAATLCEIIQPAVDRMRLQATRAGLTLDCTCPEDLPAIQADVDRIQQVLMNLLHNAVKFTPPGGRIDVDATQTESMIRIEIRDTGVGIPETDLPRIFERFYKADRARSGGGTGLGLSIARHIVEAHGGKIWAESQPGSGSSFFFTLPIQ